MIKVIMGLRRESGTNYLSKLSLSPKISALECSLQQSLSNFRELLNDFEQLSKDLDECKTELSYSKEKCASKACDGSEALKTIIEAKNNIISAVASTATKLNETKNFKYLEELFKILCGETAILTPPKETSLQTTSKPQSPTYSPEKVTSPKKELNVSIDLDNVSSIREESISEIEGTPTRSTSPIISSRKTRSSSMVSLISSSGDGRDKKKCPEDWSTPEAKVMKLNYPMLGQMRGLGAGRGRLKQTRLVVSRQKSLTVVDLTCSPVVTGGVDVMPLITKESSENDDTILPSPTSTHAGLQLSKTSAKENHNKSKKPLSLMRKELKPEAKLEVNSPLLQEFERCDDGVADMELSINILQPKRFQVPKASPMKNRPMTSPKKNILSPKKNSRSSPKKLKTPKKEPRSPQTSPTYSPAKSLRQSPEKNHSPLKKSPHQTHQSPVKKSLHQTRQSPIKNMKESLQVTPEKVVVKEEIVEEDLTRCEESSVSILQHVQAAEAQQPSSPSKGPLAENINVTNVPVPEPNPGQLNDAESMSILHEPKKVEAVRRKTPEKVQPLFVEPLPRKKADKMALPAWLCDDCRDVLNELYSDEPEKIARIVARCSKHRGKVNPVRPKTPPGFWNPRWDVPRDTEEFNRRNNAN